MEDKLLNISKHIIKGFYRYDIQFVDYQGNPGNISVGGDKWNRSDIISALIRTRYSQDQVEAIINNHFLNIGEWLDKKLAGENEEFIDEDYNRLQEWRSICKQWANEAIEKYPEIV